MVEYVAGFLFSECQKYVAMVRKNKPEWQKGKLNGIGGKIEAGETPHEAMVREFREETGILIPAWDNTAIINGNGWTVYFFHQFDNNIWGTSTIEDEEIVIHHVDDILLGTVDYIKNIPVLLTLALDDSGILKPVKMEDHT